MDFFVENKLDYEVEKFDHYEVYYETKNKKIKIYRGSILTTPIAEKFDLIYDRAALVAMNPTDRKVIVFIYDRAKKYDIGIFGSVIFSSYSSIFSASKSSLNMNLIFLLFFRSPLLPASDSCIVNS